MHGTALGALRQVENLLGPWPLEIAVVAFILAAGVIGLFGSRLAKVVNRLADRTGVGEAIAGAVLLGASTSLAGLIVSILAAVEGDASLAVSNSVGGIAAQTAFIVVADIAYRSANLEHAAASAVNIFSAVLMVVLLGIVIIGYAVPPVTFFGIHPATILLFTTYGYGVYTSYRVRLEPMWRPQRTGATRSDEPDHAPAAESVRGLWLSFAGLAATVAAAGWVVGTSGISVIDRTGLSGTVVGVIFTSVATSIPELVTSVAAVRAGALTMAVGGIIGGNTFDILFIAVADLFYRPGSLYAAMADSDVFAVGWTLVMTGIIAAGLVRRERDGIGFEGFAMLGIYAAGLGVIVLMG